MIELLEKERVSVIKLNRPASFNALSTELLNELNQVLDEVDRNEESICSIITGNGDKAFCAGADLKERKSMTDKETIQAVRLIGKTNQRIEKMQMPVIAAINGVAFGGGLELALACDIRIAAEHAKLGLTETSLAIIPGAGGTQRLPRLIGLGPAKRMIYTAKPITAQEALHLRLIDDIASSDELMKDAFSLAKSIAKNGPIALRQAKFAINQGIETDLNTGLEIEHLSYQQTIPTKDRKEGLLAFSEKRKPIYKGE